MKVVMTEELQVNTQIPNRYHDAKRTVKHYFYLSMITRLVHHPLSSLRDDTSVLIEVKMGDPELDKLIHDIVVYGLLILVVVMIVRDIMYTTLLELERTHGFPMVVRDVFSQSWYLILGRDADSIGSHIYKAKPLGVNEFKTKVGSPEMLLYGGYHKWEFMGKADLSSDGISPEEQKRISLLRRKQTNERLANELKRGKANKRKVVSKEEFNLKRLNPNSQNKVIPFRKKEDKQ